MSGTGAVRTAGQGRGESGEAVTGCGEMPWLVFLNEAEITATEAMGYLNLGEPAHADTLFRAALAGDLPPRNRTLYAAQLAVAILGQGRLDDAIAVGNSVLAAIEEGISSARVLEELRPIYDAAKAIMTGVPGASDGSGHEARQAGIKNVTAGAHLDRGKIGGSGEEPCH